MTLDLSNAAHRDALREACLASPEERAGAMQMTGDAPFLLACSALSSPEQSAAIVRALLEGCGVELPRDEPSAAGDADVRPDGDMLLIWVRLDGTWVRRDRAMPGVPALILALLAYTDAAGALAALREAGR